MKDHTAKSFEPKYKEYYRVVQMYGTNALQVSDKQGKLHNVHITDVKRVTMTEKVATQMKEIYNKGRTAKNLTPQGLLPDLGWKTDQQEEGRQPLPVEKTTETTVTPTTPNQVEGSPSSRLQSKTKQLNLQKHRIHRNAILSQWTHQMQSKRLIKYKLLQEPATGCKQFYH